VQQCTALSSRKLPLIASLSSFNKYLRPYRPGLCEMKENEKTSPAGYPHDVDIRQEGNLSPEVQ
jgi:hypothetical protein